MIYLIRHGQTEFNVQGRMQGQRDSPLTALGEEQARRMGRCLKTFVDDPARWSVICSPLGRTRRTAEIVCETLGLGCEIELEPRLAEVHVGEWEGLTRAEISAREPGRLDQRDWIFTAPGGETFEVMAARLAAWLAEVDEADGRRRIVVSHGVAGRLLRNLYGGGDRASVWLADSPPQDAVFLLRGGVAGRIDDGWEDDR